MCVCENPRSCVKCEGWNKDKGMSIEDARAVLSGFKKEVNRSGGFGDAEVYYIDDDGNKVNEGYLGSRYGGKDDLSSITVKGEEFKGVVARAVMK